MPAPILTERPTYYPTITPRRSTDRHAGGDPSPDGSDRERHGHSGGTNPIASGPSDAAAEPAATHVPPVRAAVQVPEMDPAPQSPMAHQAPHQPRPHQPGPHQPGPEPLGSQQSGQVQAGPFYARPEKADPLRPDPLQAGSPQAGPPQAGPPQAGPPQAGPYQPTRWERPTPPAPVSDARQHPGPFPPSIDPRPQQPGPHPFASHQTVPHPAPDQPGPQQPVPYQSGHQQPGLQPNPYAQQAPYQPYQEQAPYQPAQTDQPPQIPQPLDFPPSQQELGRQGFPPAPDNAEHGIPPQYVPPQPRVEPPADPYQSGPAADGYADQPWMSDGTAPTAEEFARRRLARPTEPVANWGARAIVRRGTGGLIKMAPGRREQEFKRDVEMVRRNFGGLRQVTVVNPKGGAGKTVAVLLLAMTFGQKRGGYVLAWDNNETQGTLGMRAQQDFHARTVRDMMRDLHLFHGSHGRVGDLSQYVRSQGEGMFDVLASDESATAGEMLTANAFGEIREIVSRFYKLIFVDTGNNVRAQNWQAAMDATDQLVVTMSARNDSAETAARMLDHLEQSGRQRLVRQAISVVSMPAYRKDIDLPAIERHFAARTRAVVLAPYEKLIDSGEPMRYGHLSNATKHAWLKIAAAVAEGL